MAQTRHGLPGNGRKPFPDTGLTRRSTLLLILAGMLIGVITSFIMRFMGGRIGF